jgi:hypothetical protein
MVSSFVKVSQHHIHLQNVTVQAYRIEKCVTNTKLQDLVENGKQSFTTFDIQDNVYIDVSSVHSFVLSLNGIKARNCSLLDQL